MYTHIYIGYRYRCGCRYRYRYRCKCSLDVDTDLRAGICQPLWDQRESCQAILFGDAAGVWGGSEKPK